MATTYTDLTTYDNLPPYLKKYCCDQDYEAYTTRDHAAWRFIMRQNREFFRKHAVSIYEEGLHQTGIPIDRIPRVSEMDEKLHQYGWGAVTVNGFIPPAAFLEFQALGILAIAADMRTAEHIEYTPAPDIVHESAGHAPIIADPDYRTYLKRYAQMAKKAIFSTEDINLYEAIRYLSDIKENPDTDLTEAARAEERFQAAVKSLTHTSEAAKVGRMAWWTVEYGLVGPIEDPLIYGAGLLSSVGESQNCLSDRVKKIPLSIECVEQNFDITKQQPQLYVAKDLGQLTEVLEEFEKTLSFRRGGIDGLKKAEISQSINTVIMDSGIEISGQIAEYELSSDGKLEFLKLTGPVQLAHNTRQLLGHGRSRHPKGFSAPFGRWKGLTSIPGAKASDEDLRKIGIQRGRRCRLEFVSGFTVIGTVAGWKREGGNVLFITWRGCTVQRGEKIYFQPEWGDFDMAVGEMITSVHGGPANREDFGEYNVGKGSTRPGRVSPFTDEETHLFDLYAALRNIRSDKYIEKHKADHIKALQNVAQAVKKRHQKEWLIALEALEIGVQQLSLPIDKTPYLKSLKEMLMDTRPDQPNSLQALIQKGVEIARTP